MSPPTEQRRPLGEGDAVVTAEENRALATVAGLRRRVEAAHRLEPIRLGHGDLYRRDPWAVEVLQRTPSSFGMSTDELISYATELLSEGWADWEVVTLLDLGAVA